jgi:hypothetical protein
MNDDVSRSYRKPSSACTGVPGARLDGHGSGPRVLIGPPRDASGVRLVTERELAKEYGRETAMPTKECRKELIRDAMSGRLPPPRA